MLVKILGAIDLIAGLILLFNIGVSFPTQVLLICGVIYIIKAGLSMFKDIASWIDAGVALIFLLSTIITIPGAILIIVGLLVIQKGFISFL